MYIDLVLARHENNDRGYLFQAPFCSGLQGGDEVIVDTRRGTAFATVVNTIGVDTDTATYKFIVSAHNATDPLRKVLSQINYKHFKYEDEDKEAEIKELKERLLELEGEK